MKKLQGLGNLILYSSIYIYVSIFVGIVLLAAVAYLIYWRISKPKSNEDKPKMSKPLFIANIIVYAIIGIILVSMIFFLLRPLELFF